MVFHFHGGGWILGDKDTNERLDRELANAAQAVVVFVDYTPAPDAQYPVQNEQAYTALQGAIANAAGIGEQESSGQILAGLLPAGARLVKAFGTLSAPSLSAAARQEPDRAVLFYAADDDAAGDLVADLIRAAGFDPVRVGGLDQSIRIEMFGDLHEYGALGRVVTRTEALKAI